MPIAKPDQARTLRDVPVVIAVLGNDEGSNLSIGGYTLPPAGALVRHNNEELLPGTGVVLTDGDTLDLGSQSRVRFTMTGPEEQS